MHRHMNAHRTRTSAKQRNSGTHTQRRLLHIYTFVCTSLYTCIVPNVTNDNRFIFVWKSFAHLRKITREVMIKAYIAWCRWHREFSANRFRMPQRYHMHGGINISLQCNSICSFDVVVFSYRIFLQFLIFVLFFSLSLSLSRFFLNSKFEAHFCVKFSMHVPPFLSPFALPW